MRFLLAIMLALLTLLGCGPRVEAATAASVRISVNGAEQPIFDAYELQLAESTAGVKILSVGLANQAAVKLKWKPIFESHEALKKSHDAWAEGLERGDTGGIGRVKTAYCILRAIAKKQVPLPDWQPQGCAP